MNPEADETENRHGAAAPKPQLEPPPDPGRVFHALGDPTRRAIVEMLSQAPRTVSYLAAALEITLTAVGQHLAILEACGLAQTEKLGRTRTCSLDRTGLATLEHWIKDRRTPLESSLDRLGEFLEESPKTEPI